MRIRPRSARAWLLIATRTLAAVLALTAAVIHGRPLFAVAMVGAAIALILAAFRRRAPTAPGALYTAAADLLTHGITLPGQLSLTTSAVAWFPSRYSLRHGRQAIRVEVAGCREISLQRGYGVMDVVLTVVQADGATFRFGTRTSRGLTHTLDSFEASSGAVGVGS